jgi:hypothetical protein
MRNIYLVAYYFKRPRDNRVRTQIAGWQNNQNNVSYDEQVAVTHSLRKRDETMASIILDMVNRRVVKNRWQSGRSFDELLDYFAKSYPQHTTELMRSIDAARPNPGLAKVEAPVITVPTGEIRTVDTQ